MMEKNLNGSGLIFTREQACGELDYDMKNKSCWNDRHFASC